MPAPTTRDQIREAMENLPPDATFDDAIERLVFLAKIEAGLAQLDAGQGIPHDEVKRRLGLWPR
jgi:predicted transcriptional regulator